MILRVLKSNQRSNLYLFPVIALLLWLKSLIYPFSYDFYPGENSNILFSPLYKLVENFEFLQVMISLVFVILLASVVQILNEKYTFIRVRTKLPASLFVIIVAGFTQLHTFHPVYPAALFLMIALFNLFETFEKLKPYSNIFNAGFFLGVGTLFYLNLFILLPAFLIGVVLLSRETSWRGWIIILIGFAVPAFFASSYAILTEHTKDIVIILEKNIFTPVNHFRSNIPLYVLLSVLVLLTVAASFKIIQQYDTKKVSTRKYFSIFLVLFISAMISFMFVPVTSQEMLVIMAIPVTYLITNLFVFIKNKFWSEFLFYLLIAIVILMQFSEKFILNG